MCLRVLAGLLIGLTYGVVDASAQSQMVPELLRDGAVRFEYFRWNKGEDAPNDGNRFAPRRRYRDSKLGRPADGEIFCGWSVLQEVLANAVWEVHTVSATGGAIFHVSVPENQNLEGRVVVNFTARFVNKSAIPAGASVICEGNGWLMRHHKAVNRIDPIWDYREPSRCVTREGVGYYCDRPPPRS